MYNTTVLSGYEDIFPHSIQTAANLVHIFSA